MKLKFENQDFQLQAVYSVVRLFTGMQTLDLSQQLVNNNEILSFDIVPNGLQIETDKLSPALQNIQQDNQLVEKSQQLYYGDYHTIPNFSVEMETGTGKTYVYLRTIFELNKCYGLLKFIIVVPSDAIRIGVLKSLEMTQQHFKGEFNNLNYDYYRYDSNKVNKVRDFATANTIQIMVMSIASFNKDSDDGDKKGNVIFDFKDKYGEHRPIDLIRNTKPILIIDEPQSVDNTLNAKNAIKKLNPLFILRYSATHKEPYNLVYKLDAIEAYKKHLVKQIEVASIEDAPNSISTKPYLKVVNITAKKASLTLDLELEVIKSGKSTRKIIKNLTKGADLEAKTNNGIYSGYIVEDFSVDYGLKLSVLDNEITIGQSIGGNISQELKTRVMMQLVITNHIKRELILAKQDIKVLSLFFIDKVADYRDHANNQDHDAWLAKMFIEEFKNILKTKGGKSYIELCKTKFNRDLTDETELSNLHGGYFAKDNKGNYKDSKDNTQDAVYAYELIMIEKEKLLNPHEPLRFIFSHSALKEGWDNPNVFQVCVLQDSTNTFKRRQQIGRGLRLCVNSSGDRVSDINVNTLTVVAGESFKNFANNLQNEYASDANIKFSNNSLPIKNQIDRVEIELNEYVYKGLDGNFKRLWNKIKAKTIYTAKLDSEALIVKVVNQLKKKINIDNIKSDKVNIHRSRINLTNIGISGSLLHESDILLNYNNDNINIISILSERTNLTRKTIVEILQGISLQQLELAHINNQSFINIVETEINNVKNKLLVDGIRYHKYAELNLDGVIDKADYYYAQSLFDKLEHGYKNNTSNGSNILDANTKNFIYENENIDFSGLSDNFSSKFLYNVLRFDSKPEVKFLRDCLAREEVKTITKLPSWFKVNTPLGKYNPDWALLIQKDGMEEVYFIAETKPKDFASNGRVLENEKVICGEKHFVDTLQINYKVGHDAKDILD